MEVFGAYQEKILYATIVLLAAVTLYFINKFVNKGLVRKSLETFLTEEPRSLHLLRHIINALIIVLGVMALSAIFIDENSYAALRKNFNLVAYLGVVAVVTIVAASTADFWFKKTIQKKLSAKDDPTNFKFLRYIAVASIYFLGALLMLLAFPGLRGVAQTALGGAGVIALIVGLASQEAFANVISGIFIISFKPFKIGDTVKLDDSMEGTVSDITLRHTVIRNFENKMIVIPNSIINKEKLINYDLDDKRCCERIDIGISYDSDIDLAKKIMSEECEKHPLIVDIRTRAEKNNGVPMIRTAVTELGESSVTIRAWAWAKNFPDSFVLKCDILESTKKRFDREGIEIPFPHRTVVIKNKPGEFRDMSSAQDGPS